MVTEFSLITSKQNERDTAILTELARAELAKKNISIAADELTLVVQKRSVDARHGRVKIVLRVKAYIGEVPPDENFVPKWQAADGSHSVIIIGAGPAGLFAALRLLEDGIKPIIIERGKAACDRKKDIGAIGTSGTVNADSNYCFGAGGAGTFSDGKLYTRSTKRGNVGRALAVFTYFGADKTIMTDAHPHIGTDKLPGIIDAMTEKIRALGGDVRFNTRCIDFVTVKQNGVLVVTGVHTADVRTNEMRTFTADAVILATGHSAVDMYRRIAEIAPAALEAKTFAAGVRIEHPRKLIDRIQYHGKGETEKLPAAEYRLAAQIDGRGVYSFCMCPGGYVVPAATGPDEIVTNGMSSSARNSPWSNAAIVAEIRPEDIPAEFQARAAEAGCPALAGLFFRTALERQTKQNGDGQKAPAQNLVDFLYHRESGSLPRASYAPGIVKSRLDLWLPERIASRLIQAFPEFDKKMRGFISDDAVLIASETRTSAPVRITRDKTTRESAAVKNLFPVGECSGYSGGIVSSAIDGDNTAAEIVKMLRG